MVPITDAWRQTLIDGGDVTLLGDWFADNGDYWRHEFMALQRDQIAVPLCAGEGKHSHHDYGFSHGRWHCGPHHHHHHDESCFALTYSHRERELLVAHGAMWARDWFGDDFDYPCYIAATYNDECVFEFLWYKGVPSVILLPDTTMLATLSKLRRPITHIMLIHDAPLHTSDAYVWTSHVLPPNVYAQLRNYRNTNTYYCKVYDNALDANDALTQGILECSRQSPKVLPLR